MIVEELNNSENKCCSTSLLSNDSETSLIPSANEFNDTTEHKFIKSRWFRYIVAILIIFLPIGVFCCFDAPSAMAKEMANYPPGVDASKIMFLMSFYSLPNIVFAFIGGFVVDSVLGLRNGAITFAITVFVGYTIEIIGVFSNQLWLMCVGRLIFGLGGESLQVTANAYIIKWFSQYGEVNTVFGLLLSVARLGTSISLMILPSIYKSIKSSLSNSTKLGFTFCVVLLFCLLTLVLSIILKYLDIMHDKVNKTEITEKTQDEKCKVKITDVKHFTLSYYLVSLVIVLFYVAVIPFISQSSYYFQHKYDYTDIKAGVVTGTVFIIASVASPIIGFLVDFFGCSIYWMQSGLAMILIAHILFCFTFIPPMFQSVLIAFSLCFVGCTLWPMVALTVNREHLGTALGLTQSIQNLGLSTISILVGYISKTYGYTMSEYFFIIIATLALLISYLLHLSDMKNGLLNKSKKRFTKLCNKLK